MEIKLDKKTVAITSNNKILWSGVDLNKALDAKLETLEPREDEGIVYYDYIKPTLLAKLVYLESLGYTIVPDRKYETKAQTTDSPLTLQPNEEMGPSEKKLKKQIIDLLKSNKEKIFELLEEQGKPDNLLQIKSIDDLPGIIKKIFEIFTFKKIVDEVISFKFNFGWEKSEKQIDQNVPMNNKAVEFLQDHTFDNIKGMTEEIANDLQAELSRGIINGEGITKLKERVSKVFNVGENRAEMIARTESNRAENNGRLLAMKNSGLKMKKQWVAALDERTSELCKHLDGREIGLDDDFKHGAFEGQSPPAHVNCRSTMIFIEDEEEEAE